VAKMTKEQAIAEIARRKAAGTWKGKPAPESSGAAALFSGVADTATPGFADEIAGAAGALGGAFSGVDGAPGMAENYKTARDEARADFAKKQKEHPYLVGGGQGVGLALTAPLAAGKTALEVAGRGGILAATNAAGQSEAENPAEMTKEMLEAGVLGVASPQALAGASDAAKHALSRFGEDADLKRVLTTVGATSGAIAKPRVLEEANRVPGGIEEMARVLRESGISKGITTTSGILKRSQIAQDASGAKIGAMIDEATGKGGLVDTVKLASRLRREAADAVSGMTSVSGISRDHAEALNKFAKRIEKAAPRGSAPPDQIKAMSVALSEDAQQAYRAKSVGKNVAGKGKALMDTRRNTETGIDDMMDQIGMSSDDYRGARRLNQVSRIANEGAETSLGRSGKNNLIGLTTAALAAVNPVIGALHFLTKPLQAGARATAAEVARAISEDPQVLGPLGPEMASYISRAVKLGGVPKLLDILQNEPEVIDSLQSGSGEPPSKVQDFNTQIDKMNQR